MTGSGPATGGRLILVVDDDPQTCALLRDLCAALDGLFATFLKQRASSAWEGQTGNLRRWILQPAKPVAAVA